MIDKNGNATLISEYESRGGKYYCNIFEGKPGDFYIKESYGAISYQKVYTENDVLCCLARLYSVVPSLDCIRGDIWSGEVVWIYSGWESLDGRYCKGLSEEEIVEKGGRIFDITFTSSGWKNLKKNRV